MPNHCDNDLSITGPAKERKRFLALAMEGDSLLSANKFIPYPQKFRDQDAKCEAAGGIFNAKGINDGFSSGGYEWCCNNWGTKWGMYDVNRTAGKRDLKYNFRSAWAPPSPVIKKMGKMFPTLTFRLHYYEAGNGFQGTLVIKDGKVIEEQTGNYNGHRGG